jgi:O-Antigen ligase
VSALTAPAESPLQTGPESSPAPSAKTGGRAPLGGLLRADALWWPTLLTAGVICFLTFLGGGGLHLGPMTTVEMALTIGSAVIVAAIVVLVPLSGRMYGAWAIGLLFAFTALTALSVIWSVQPDESFKDAGRLLAYSALFGASVVLARAFPSRWPAVLGGVTLAAVVVCSYALLTKVFPGQFDANDPYARLRAPYDYWNAIGLTAAMGVICCLWLGARRAGHALLSALAYPAMGLMLVTLMLAYSRGALVALALGLALWFCLVPLRLRGAAVLLAGVVGAGVVVAWDFSRHTLTTEGVALGARVTAGQQLGTLLAAMLVLLTLAGLAVGFQTGRQAPSSKMRRNAGITLLALLAVAVIAFAGALAASHRGLPGSISHGFHSLTDTNARVPNTPGRLTAVASVRARYWNEALKVFQAHPVLGAGAEGYRMARLRYRTAPIEVRHAHGFVVQTLADLGLVGLTLALALLGAWMLAAGRSTHPFNRRWMSGRAAGEADGEERSDWRPGWRRWTIAGRAAPYTPERIGTLCMLCLVVVFGIHSLVDWTWYVPGNACVALLCAGWLAGRGPLERSTAGEHSEVLERAMAERSMPLPAGAPDPDEPLEEPGSSGPARWRPSLREVSPVRAGVACAVLVAALLGAWAQWQPQSSETLSQEALALLGTHVNAASAKAQAAVARDPVSVQALFALATVQQATGNPDLARATLQHAVRMQPSNPETWLRLGQYDLASVRAQTAGADVSQAAVHELGAAIYLNPESIAPEAIADGNPEAISIQNDYVEALRAATR